MNKLILVITISVCVSVRADMITKINTIRKMDAHTRQFLTQTGEIARSAGSLKGKFNCMKKNRDGSLQNMCAGRGCKDIESCLFAIFKEMQAILDPIMQNLVGVIETGSGKLKPGALTALPLLWDDPKPASITKMQNILVNHIAVSLNDVASLIKLLRDSLDPDIKPEDKEIPVQVDAAKVDEMALDQAPLPAGADENATAPSTEEMAPAEKTASPASSDTPTEGPAETVSGGDAPAQAADTTQKTE